jgi:cell division protein FtsW
MKKNKIDKTFFIIVAILVIIGLIVFTSASLGILAKNEAKFYGVLFGQYVFGFIFGLLALLIGLKIPYNLFKKYSLLIFLFSLILTGLVLIPGIGQTHGGATRWIEVLGYSFQPVEFLKIGFIIYFAAWLSWVRNKVKDPLFSILPLIIFIGLISVILLRQPDTKNLILIVITSLIMLFVSGAPIKYILGILTVSLIAFVILVSITPYLKQRVNTFLNPSQNSQSSSYQLQQSLIAVGSGGVSGRGLGQSIQKFNYLPEPQGDSIFAVIGEELGFIGTFIILFLYVFFALRGYKIAVRNAPDSFSKLMVVGFISIITAQSFMNMASIIGIFPLTGVPLVFISHGGTALFLSLGMIGIILNISQYQSKIY